MELRAVKMGDAPRHLYAGWHRHQAVTFWTRAASICDHLGAQNLLERILFY